MTRLGDQAYLASAGAAVEHADLRPLRPGWPTARGDTPPRLLMEGVSKRWGRRADPILEHVHVSIPTGTIVSVVGKNGVGKTTLLRIAAGLIDPDRGRVELDGLGPRRNRAEYQRRLGFVSAGYGGLYARLTVEQQLELGARISLVRRDERRPRCHEAMLRFGLVKLARKRVDRLSMGQRQRVRLALAFLHEPRLVLLDEPWNSLDPDGANLLGLTLLQLRSAGGTALCCTPTGAELENGPARPDTVLRIEDGRVVAE